MLTKEQFATELYSVLRPLNHLKLGRASCHSERVDVATPAERTVLTLLGELGYTVNADGDLEEMGPERRDPSLPPALGAGPGGPGGVGGPGGPGSGPGGPGGPGGRDPDRGHEAAPPKHEHEPAPPKHEPEPPNRREREPEPPKRAK